MPFAPSNAYSAEELEVDMAEKRTEISPRQERSVAGREPFARSPFTMLDRFAD